MILAMISDFDGTLIDSLTEGIQSLQNVAGELGWRVPQKDEVRRQWGRPLLSMLGNLWPDQDPTRFLEAREVRGHERDACCPAYQGASEALQRLRQRGKIVGLHIRTELGRMMRSKSACRSLGFGKTSSRLFIRPRMASRRNRIRAHSSSFWIIWHASIEFTGEPKSVSSATTLMTQAWHSSAASTSSAS